MANIDRIVKCDISLNTTGISEAGFGTIMVVGPHAHSLNRVLSYTDADQLLDDGFDVSDLIYKAVNTAFSQTPKPSVVKVGRKQVDTVKVKLAAPSASVVTGTEYTIALTKYDTDLNVVTNKVTYTSVSGDDGTAVATGMTAALVTAGYTATDTDGEISISAGTGVAFTCTPSSLFVESGYVENATEDIAETMTAICAEDNDFYGINYTNRTEAEILAMAAWTESHIKIYGVGISEAGAKNAAVSSDIGSKLQELNYFRTYWFYHGVTTEFLETAIMARCFSINPGGETWANKKLAGVTVDKLTETEYNAIKAKGGNTFEKIRNVSITQIGKVAADEWIDVIRFRDWLQENIQVNIFNLLINHDKLSYTDNDIATIQSELISSLKLGQTRKGIAPTEYDEDGNEIAGFTTSVPLAANISANTKASRKLTDVKFTARLAGAIHAVEITGSLAYSL